MDNAARLQQTIRRCTAILVATIAITGAVLAPGGDGTLLVVIATGAILYPLNDFVQLFPEETDDETADSTPPDRAGSDL